MQQFRIAVPMCRLLTFLAFAAAQLAPAWAVNQASIVEAQASAPERRVALVVGNADYSEDIASNTPGVPDLANTLNDSRAMRDLLTRLGFRVVYGENLGKREMERAIGKFAALTSDAEVAVAYYSGHGSTFDDIPYLVPVDARYERLEEVPYELIRTEDYLAELRRASGVRIALLDACRDNAAEAALKRGNTRGGGRTRGLARVEHADGLIVMYATQYLSTAADGEAGANSPFTTALLSRLPTPGVDVRQALFNVAQDVVQTSKGGQRPEISVSLYTPFQLVPGDAPYSGTTADAGEETRSQPTAADPAAEAYRAAMREDTVEALEVFLRHFPQGYWSDLARARLKERKVAARREEAEQRAREAALREEAERRAREAALREERERREREAALRAEQEKLSEIRPSFDCAAASRADELAICDSPRLSQLDRLINEGYRAARKRSKSSATKVAKDGLRARGACGSDSDCILNAQVETLQAFARLGASIQLPDWALTAQAASRQVEPSFDCSAASRIDELIICATPELAELDRLVDQGYRAVREHSRSNANSVARAGLQARGSCGSDPDCIMDAQVETLHALSRLGASVQVPAWALAR